MYLKKLQADFDPLSRPAKPDWAFYVQLNRVKNKHANNLGNALRNTLASAKGLLLGDGNSNATFSPSFAFAQA